MTFPFEATANVSHSYDETLGLQLLTLEQWHFYRVPAGQEQTILFFFSFLFTAGRVFKKLQWPCALACPWLRYLSPSACDVSAGPTSAQDWHLSAAPSHLFVAPWFTPTGLTSSQITRLGWLSRANTCVWNYKRVIQNHYIVSCLN